MPPRNTSPLPSPKGRSSRRRLGRFVPFASVVVALASCTSKPERPPDLRATPGASSSPAVVPPPPASPPSARPSRCAPVRPGEVSDDDTPEVAGVSGEAGLLPWLAARGVNEAAAVTWLGEHYGVADRGQTTAAFARGGCSTLTVGEAAEEAVVCIHPTLTSIVQVHALALVVRNKRPIAVLDVGLGLQAMDFPEAHWLDLALVFSKDGMSAELRDRAPDGTTLVEAPSVCNAREARRAACEATRADGGAPRPNHCPNLLGLDGGALALPEVPTFGTPAVLHDCAGGRPRMLAMVADLAKAPPPMRADARSALAFFDKSCAQRGRWVWTGGRFARAAPSDPPPRPSPTAPPSPPPMPSPTASPRSSF